MLHAIKLNNFTVVFSRHKEDVNKLLIGMGKKPVPDVCPLCNNPYEIDTNYIVPIDMCLCTRCTEKITKEFKFISYQDTNRDDIDKVLSDLIRYSMNPFLVIDELKCIVRSQKEFEHISYTSTGGYCDKTLLQVIDDTTLKDIIHILSKVGCDVLTAIGKYSDDVDNLINIEGKQIIKAYGY